jgi:hypothetical protein
MKDLEAFIDFWRDSLARSEEQRTRLFKAQNVGISIKDEDGRDILPDLIEREDVAVRAYHTGLIRAESLLGRAQSGQDV